MVGTAIRGTHIRIVTYGRAKGKRSLTSIFKVKDMTQGYPVNRQPNLEIATKVGTFSLYKDTKKELRGLILKKMAATAAA